MLIIVLSQLIKNKCANKCLFTVLSTQISVNRRLRICSQVNNIPSSLNKYPSSLCCTGHRQLLVILKVQHFHTSPIKFHSPLGDKQNSVDICVCNAIILFLVLIMPLIRPLAFYSSDNCGAYLIVEQCMESWCIFKM